MASIPVKGLRKLNEELKTLPKKLQKKAIRKSVSAGAKLFQRQAKLNAPRKTGSLRRAIASRSNNSRSRPDIIRQSVHVRTGRVRTKSQKARSDDPYYWYFQEHGYTATGGKRSGRSSVSARGDGRKSGSKIRGRRFMHRAFESTYGRSLVVFRRTLNSELEVYRGGRV